MNALPSQLELKELSQWALVAYAVRCAQRVFPLFELWDKQGNHSATLAASIILSATAAKEGRKQDHLIDSVFAAADVRNFADADFQLKSDIASQHPFARATDAAISANEAARVAAASAAAVATAAETADSVNAAHLAAHASFCAAEVARSGDTAIRATRRDFDHLVKGLKSGKLSRTSGICPKSLGPLWAEKPPQWFWRSPLIASTLPEGSSDKEVKPGKTSQEKPSSVAEHFHDNLIDGGFAHQNLALDLYFEPGNASMESLQRVMEALTRLHIAAGGTGLNFQTDEGFIQAKERVEV